MSKLQQVIRRVNGEQVRINVFGNRLAACRKMVEIGDREAYVWTDGATAIEWDEAVLLAQYVTPHAEEARVVKGVPYAVLIEVFNAVRDNVSGTVRQGPASRRGAVCDPGYDLNW